MDYKSTTANASTSQSADRRIAMTEFSAISARSRQFANLLLPLSNIGMRGAGLVGRFALTLYFAKHFQLSEIGTFGLVAGMAGLLPSLIGCGVNYFLNREIVGADPLRAGTLLRDRLVLTLAMLLLVGLVGGAAHAAGWVQTPPSLGLLAFILAGECIAFDVHMSLIGLRMPVAANFLLFVRSASWIFPVLVLGTIWPQLRSLSLVFWSWAGGVIASFIFLLVLLRRWPFAAISRTRVDFNWIWQTVRRGWLIYLSDLGIGGQLYLERYVVNGLLGLSLTGVYTLYWTMANAVHVLVTVGVVQVTLPDLVEAHRSTDKAEWRRAFLHATGRTVAITLPLCVVCAAVVLKVLPRLGIQQFAASPDLFCLMLVGVAIRLLSDMASYGLYSRNLDTEFAATNIVGIVASLALSFILIARYGLTGAGIGMIIHALLLLLIRSSLLVRSYARQ
jgi:O-antigen/teichoic acid export membrane protein